MAPRLSLGSDSRTIVHWRTVGFANAPERTALVAGAGPADAARWGASRADGDLRRPAGQAEVGAAVRTTGADGCRVVRIVATTQIAASAMAATAGMLTPQVTSAAT